MEHTCTCTLMSLSHNHFLCIMFLLSTILLNLWDTELGFHVLYPYPIPSKVMSTQLIFAHFNPKLYTGRKLPCNTWSQTTSPESNNEDPKINHVTPLAHSFLGHCTHGPDTISGKHTAKTTAARPNTHFDPLPY